CQYMDWKVLCKQERGLDKNKVVKCAVGCRLQPAVYLFGPPGSAYAKPVKVSDSPDGGKNIGEI
uniref:hypothetical protein n=1 Tax=Lactonifactor longoviformis TaxID=341220 RepID=UPI000D46CC0C